MDCHPTFGTYRGGDCTDVAEFVFHDRSRIIKSANGVQIACANLSKVGNGLITWVGGRYKPGSRYVYVGNPTEENIVLWLRKGAGAWLKLESKLASGQNLDRIDLGVVNGKNLKYFKYRGES